MATEGRRLLESWKEISGYLHRSERTCLRWEATLGLPIHRLDGTPSARVFAYADELDGWLSEKLNHVQEEARREADSRALIKRKFLWGAAPLAALVALTTLAVTVCPIQRLFSPAPGPFLPHNPSLAVLPFANPAHDAGLEPWRTAAADLVVTDLVQSRYVNVARITDTLRRLAELGIAEAEDFPAEAVKTVSERAGVDYVATGSLLREGGDVVLTIIVHDLRRSASPAPPTPLRVTCRDEADLLGAADGLSKRIKLALGLTARHVSRDIDRRVSDISTASPQAFKLYSQGYRLAGLAKFQESVAPLQRAVEIDPGFALAYKTLHRVCQSLRREEDGKKYIQTAIELAARLSERERGELECTYYRDFANDRAKQRETLKRFCRLYPQDRFASNNLLDLYVGLEEWEEALRVAEAAWGANRSDMNICQQLMRCYQNVGLGEKAVRLAGDFLDANPEGRFAAAARVFRVRSNMLLGKQDEALADVAWLVAQSPDDPGPLLLRGTVLLQKQDFGGAAADFWAAFGRNDPGYQIEALLDLRDLCLMQGRVEEAKSHLRRGLEIAEKAEGKEPDSMWGERLILHREMAYLDRVSSQPGEALREIDAALGIEKSYLGDDPPLELLQQKALALLDLDRTEDFDRLAVEIKALIESEEKPKMMRVYHLLLGCRELKRDEPKKAAGHLWKAVDLLSVPGLGLGGADPVYFYALAEASARLDPAVAFAMYEKVTLPTVDRIHRGDLYAKSFNGMAKAFDRGEGTLLYPEAPKAVVDRAVDNYRRFLSLWGGADLVFAAIVEDAKKRLAALESR